MGEKMRLDRFLAESGEGTRSEVKGYIKKQRASVNGVFTKDPGLKVDTARDQVELDGRPVVYEKYHYYMLNKPQGCVSATRDGLSRTVLDLLEGEPVKNLFPVGRLDKDTEGFLLLTDDGPLGHELLSPRKHVDKTYLATVDTRLSDEALERFREGLDIGDEKPTMAAEISLLTEEEPWIYQVVLREGRFHQVKRMFEALGSHVMFLKRTAMGSVRLDESLEPGSYRKLTEEEVALLKRR